MKNKSTFWALIVILIYGNVAFAQTYKTDESKTTIENITEKNVENNFLATNSTSENTLAIIDNNSIFIQQIGNGNAIKTNTKSKNSNTTLSQNGNQNKIYLDVAANTIEEKVMQNGDNNYLLDFSPYGVDFHGVDVIQQGNNQNITLFGGNAISERIKINMQGDSKTIIVRNFN